MNKITLTVNIPVDDDGMIMVAPYMKMSVDNFIEALQHPHTEPYGFSFAHMSPNIGVEKRFQQGDLDADISGNGS